MDVTTSDLCDKILKAALDGLYLLQPRYFSFEQLCQAAGASADQAEAALAWLQKNFYLEKTKNTYVLTPPGETFARTGGYAGERQRQAEEEAAKQAQREFVKKQTIYANRVYWYTFIITICTAIIMAFTIMQYFVTTKAMAHVDSPALSAPPIQSSQSH